MNNVFAVVLAFTSDFHGEVYPYLELNWLAFDLYLFLNENQQNVV